MKPNYIGAILGCCAFLSGCIGTSLKPTDVYRANARQTQQVQQGTVVGVYDITIKGNSAASQAVGAAAGGYAANRAVHNTNELTRVAATSVGVLVGTIVGDTFSDLALDKSGVNIVVKSDSGNILAIAQQNDSRVRFNAGDRVWLIGDNRNVRIIPE